VATDRTTPLDYLCRVDLEAIARAQRRRQALEALEFERSREAALRDELEELIGELEGPRIDEATFARMTEEDVELVRAALAGAAAAEEVELFGEHAEGWLVEDEAPDPEAEREERLAEIGRLRSEIDASQRRQQAFEHYLAALSNGDGGGETERR